MGCKWCGNYFEGSGEVDECPVCFQLRYLMELRPEVAKKIAVSKNISISKMDFDQYQQETKKTAVYPSLVLMLPLGMKKVLGWVYPTMKLAGETGEVAEKLGKVIRDHGGDVKASGFDITKELGDVLWYVSEIARQLNLSLQDVADMNVVKLRDRADRGVIHGSGDNR